MKCMLWWLQSPRSSSSFLSMNTQIAPHQPSRNVVSDEFANEEIDVMGEIETVCLRLPSPFAPTLTMTSLVERRCNLSAMMMTNKQLSTTPCMFPFQARSLLPINVRALSTYMVHNLYVANTKTLPCVLTWTKTPNGKTLPPFFREQNQSFHSTAF